MDKDDMDDNDKDGNDGDDDMIKDKKVWFPPATNFLWRSPMLTANGATAEYFSKYQILFVLLNLVNV